MAASTINRELAILLTGKDISASRKIRGVKNELKGLQHVSRGTSQAIGNVERGIVIGATAAAGAIGYAVKAAGDFQQGMQTINTVALATPAVLGKAGEGIRALFRETGQPLTDLQAAEYDLVSAGIKLKDAQDGLTASVRLGLGAYGTTSQAVDVLTTAVNSYNLKAKDGTVATRTWTKLSDELAQAVADGKVKLDEIAASYANVAPIAAQAGVGTDEIAAALGFLTAKGVPAAEVMTQMARSLIELQKPHKALIDLQKKTHKNYADIAKQKGLAVSLNQMRADAKKLKIPFIQLFSRVEAYKFALQTTGPNQRGFAEELDRIHHSAGMTSKQFDERTQGFNYQLGVFSANVHDAAITVGTELLPQLTDLAREGVSWITDHQDEIHQFGVDLARHIHEAVSWAQSLDWKAIGKGLHDGADAAQAIASAFLHLPPGIQEFLAVGFAANKFTGGAVLDITGDLGKGVFGQFFARGAPGNPMYVIMENPGGGLPGTKGPGGGPGLIPPVPVLLTAAAIAATVHGDTPGGFTPSTSGNAMADKLIDTDAQIKILTDAVHDTNHGNDESRAIAQKQLDEFIAWRAAFVTAMTTPVGHPLSEGSDLSTRAAGIDDMVTATDGVSTLLASTSDRQLSALDAINVAGDRQSAAVMASQARDAASVVGAINAKDWSLNLNIPIQISYDPRRASSASYRVEAARSTGRAGGP